ncbi:hypothetical protein C8K30_105249 [Promicromonospora sp. AC04]|uniref:hypothetical protein n=1 Tax=Promicromonospora sp. AC04 TaxID=2135723 RepID=UPI000D4CA727|nr:hypothetical protein [Promicromonospora sp. AC04]PUB27018.1 hypothetical protein C8K30_105249 [Promicromonospora sp. AC04]
MPTKKPRLQVTVTAEVQEYLDRAHTMWPEETNTSTLVTRLMAEGYARVTTDAEMTLRRRQRARRKLASTHPWPGPPAEEHLASVREGWAE